MNAATRPAPTSAGAPSSPEAAAWKNIDGVWRQVHGNFLEKGLSIEWHDFSNGRDIDWGQSFHSPGLEICLNFSGWAELGSGTFAQAMRPEQIACYTAGSSGLGAKRLCGHLHRFFTLELSAPFLRTALADASDGLKPEIRRFLDNPERAIPTIQVEQMPAHLLGCRVHLLAPPVPLFAQDLWYQSKTVEILACLLYRLEKPAELFCQRHHRLNRERCERARFLLERDLENPPSLEMLAAEVQCSSFYLSRIFVQQTGHSIPRYLRLKRLEKAAALLRSGEMSVVDAAMAVGYSSLSAFTRAFVEHFACSPGLYSTACHAGRSL